MDPNNIQIDEPKEGCSLDMTATLFIIGAFIVAIIKANTPLNIAVNVFGFLLIVISIFSVCLFVYDLIVESESESRLQITEEE